MQFRCAECGRCFVFQFSRRGRALNMASAIETLTGYGWVIREKSPPYCSEGCAANSAIDITPQTAEIEPPRRQIEGPT